MDQNQQNSSENHSTIGSLKGTFRSTDYPPTLRQDFINRDGNFIFHDSRKIQRFKIFSIICNVCSCVFCPITLCCSLYGCVISLLSYADNRVGDNRNYAQKNSCSSKLAFLAIIFGFLLLIGICIIIVIFNESIYKVFIVFIHVFFKRFPQLNPFD